jgi:hypothetical protein
VAERIDILLAEYKEVCAEVRQAMTLLYSALGVGLTLITVVAKECVTAFYDDKPFVYCLLLLSIPLLALFTLFAWIGEVARMRRASVYLAQAEKTISALLPRSEAPETFGFHSWLLSSKGRPLLKMNYLMTAITLLSIGGGSLILLLLLLHSDPSLSKLWAPTFFVVGGFVLGAFYVTARLWLINQWKVPANLLEARPERKIETDIRAA